MADFIAVTLTSGIEQFINLDYVVQVEPHEEGSLISMAGDSTGLNHVVVQGSPYNILRKSLISNA
jgi:hypothetical protein